MNKIKWINSFLAEYSPTLNIITLVGVIFAIINPYCLNNEQKVEKLTVSILKIDWPRNYKGKDALVVDLCFTNQGFKNCIIPQVRLFLPFYRYHDRDMGARIISSIDVVDSMEMISVTLNPKEVIKKRFIFPYGELKNPQYNNEPVVSEYDANAEIEMWAIDSKGDYHFNKISNIILSINNEKIVGVDFSKAINKIDVFSKKQ